MTPDLPDDVAFLLACAANPADALPRLAWADYMDETDRPVAAECLRQDRAAEVIDTARRQLDCGKDARSIAATVLGVVDGELLRARYEATSETVAFNETFVAREYSEFDEVGRFNDEEDQEELRGALQTEGCRSAEPGPAGLNGPGDGP